jgi:hypothetical protein
MYADKVAVPAEYHVRPRLVSHDMYRIVLAMPNRVLLAFRLHNYLLLCRRFWSQEGHSCKLLGAT